MGYSKKSVQQATALGNLSDVSITSVADTQVLTYNSASGKWKNAAAGGGGGGTPAGSSGYIQYNTAGAFDASSKFIWTQATETLNVNGGTPELSVIGSDSTGGLIKISNTNTDTECGEFTFLKNAAAQDNMKLGRIDFDGYNDAGTPGLQNYGRIVATATDVSDGTEDSKMEFSTQANSVLTNTLTLNAGNVGIGTTAPAHTLDILAADGVEGLHVSGAADEYVAGLVSNYTTDEGWGLSKIGRAHV